MSLATTFQQVEKKAVDQLVLPPSARWPPGIKQSINWYRRRPLDGALSPIPPDRSPGIKEFLKILLLWLLFLPWDIAHPSSPMPNETHIALRRFIHVTTSVQLPSGRERGDVNLH